MKPLIFLIIAFAVSAAGIKLYRGEHDLGLAGRIAMAAMLLFTAVGHFAFTKGMAMMLPDFIPLKIGVVYLTGLIEIAAAIGLLIPGLSVLTGWLLIAFFVCILPANIHAAVNKVDFQNANFDGDGVNYLWFRIPLQILFIVWTYLAAIKFR